MRAAQDKRVEELLDSIGTAKPELDRDIDRIDIYTAQREDGTWLKKTSIEGQALLQGKSPLNGMEHLLDKRLKSVSFLHFYFPAEEFTGGEDDEIHLIVGGAARRHVPTPVFHQLSIRSERPCSLVATAEAKLVAKVPKGLDPPTQEGSLTASRASSAAEGTAHSFHERRWGPSRAGGSWRRH